MSAHFRGGCALFLLIPLLAARATPAVDEPPKLEKLRLVAPASPGGGWDQTARAMADALRKSGLVGDVDVVNSPGAGGAIGLAQFLGEPGKGDALLVGGLVMISAIRAHRATVSLAQATPIARLTGDYEVIAVPAASDLEDLAELVQALRINPGAVTWGGGSGGGADELFLAELARAIGVEPVRLNYVAFSGGGEVLEALLANRLTAGISGYSELASAIEAGRLRPLAISSPRRLPQVPVATLRDQGIDVTFVNWRGVFAPPALSENQRAVLQSLIDAMARTAAWRDALRRHGWSDLYLTGDAFARFLQEEEARVAGAPAPRSAARPATVWTWDMWLLRNRVRLGIAAALLAALAAAVVAWLRISAVRREHKLSHQLEEVEAKYQERSAEAQELLRGLSEQIDKQFDKWGLTAAEREVGMLMLKGLRHKEIASIRGTSERTVRQQALTIYRKAGLDGRTDLAAFFLEDFLQPMERGQRNA